LFAPVIGWLIDKFGFGSTFSILGATLGVLALAGIVLLRNAGHIKQDMID